jgi:transcriptional regulator with XRE-family HTH domain
MPTPRNLVGPQVRALRDKRGMTQPDLVARCQLIGWPISREILAKIEAQIRWVADFELIALGKALNVEIDELYPAGRFDAAKPLLRSL